MQDGCQIAGGLLRGNIFIILTSCFAALFLVACQSAVQELDTIAPVIATVVPTQSTLPVVTPEPSFPAPLLVWLPDALVAPQEPVADAIFKQQLREFEDSEFGILVDWRAKSSHGDGSVISTLRSAQEVAPSAIPDLVLLKREQLAVAAADGLIQEWQSLPTGLISDIPEVALSGGEYSGLLYGFPYSLTFRHLAYDEQKWSPENADFSYAALLQGQQTTIAMPLSDYASLRSWFEQQLASDADGKLAVSTVEEARSLLEEIFAFYEIAISEGILVDWEKFDDGTTLWPITSDDYLSRQAAGESVHYAPIPSSEGSALAIWDGWYWALPNPDPERKNYARRLALWMSDAPNQTAYLKAILGIPARLSTLSVAAEGDYEHFLLASMVANGQTQFTKLESQNSIHSNFESLIRREINTAEALAAIFAPLEPEP